ncbi:MAG TPA: BTAD domain-containing putative transcriptional regulator [Acidimicrobiales bacterium]|nr:BTAD domain-containing putative transcriptional regulator [Acidimicrobiales bacterium]
MNRLPPYHVPRPRLTGRSAGHRVVVVEAAAGYGKSVFAAELVDYWRSVGVDVVCEHGGVTAPLLAARLQQAARRAGFTEAAAAAEGKQDQVDLVDTLVASLAEENCTFIVDDAHNVDPDAGRLIDHLANALQGDQRLVVLARRLPPGAGRLRRAEYLQLSAADLALEPNETLLLCRTGFGLEVGPKETAALDKATGSWTAATVLAAARAARTGEGVIAVAEAAAGPGHPAGAVAAILDEALDTLGPALRSPLAQVSRLPLLDADLVEAASGQKGLFERSMKAGIPFTPGLGRWWDLAGPVRDYLSALAPVRKEAMARAAEAYRARGQPVPAFELLLASGDANEAAAVLAATSGPEEDAMDALELRAHFDRLPPEAVDAHPSVLVLVARRLGHASKYSLCCELLDHAQEIATRTADAVLYRSAAAELAKVRQLAELDYSGAEAAARDVLAAAGPDEQLTRARANEFLGFALCRRVDGRGRLDEVALAEAEECFARASQLYLGLGRRAAASYVYVDWTVHIDFPRGQFTRAMDRIEEALRLLADRPTAWGFVMIWRAMLAGEVGQAQLCRDSVDEVFRVAELKKSSFQQSHGHWRLAVLHSYTGDADATLHHIRQVESLRAGWWSLSSGEFLSDAADMLDRVGHTPLAHEYLARAKAEPKDAGHLVALADAVLEARHGDPEVAEERLAALASHRVDPREQWRVTLMQAYAAFRRGQDGVAAVLAAQACEEAARLGQPLLPLVRERTVTEQLLALAANTEQPAAVALRASALPMSLAVLGRFELTVGGRPVPLRPGQEAQLLKFVTASGGRVHSEQAIEVLWPEVARSAGRNRLRTVLNRLRATAGSVLNREGEILALDEALQVDVQEFFSEARRAQTLASRDLALATAVARGAMARYRGDLLPDDRYDDWAEKPRQQAKLAMLELLDLCATEAARRGDLDGLRRAVERTIEFAPYDDVRYLRAASALLEQGRRGEALAVVHRARSAFAQLGLGPPRSLLELEQSIVA